MTVPNVKASPIGRKIERIRELRGMKQETLATELGISQQAVSKMEQSEEIDEEKLIKVAEILGVPVETIKNFNEESAIYNIQNNYDNAANNVNYQNNPIEKVTELYERLLKEANQKIAALETKLKDGEK
jgi:transcriptional regulator with XRE-family HTH domain